MGSVDPVCSDAPLQAGARRRRLPSWPSRDCPSESPCAYDCGRDGWLQLSRDGSLLFVGDSGDVIDTANRKVIATLSALANTRKSIEVDWRGGVPVATSEPTGVGYVE